jgi:2-polyprenyl-6-hydroxyphenyl methylase/3-demethylubiquinone-9 3-methyltransferase
MGVRTSVVRWSLNEKELVNEADIHAAEVARGARFEFGANWTAFLQRLDDERIRLAEQSLRQMLARESLEDTSFVDIGSGSGLFSLAARRLGARVTSFDFDPQSVACTRELKRRYYPDDERWHVAEGSILDESFVAKIGAADIIYSWGVLHHTGALWQALEHALRLVAPGGHLFIAIYNDQGRDSRIWLRVKRTYNALPRSFRWLVLVPALCWIWGPTILRDTLQRRPLASWKNYVRSSTRGMSPWHDVRDWVGGLPFEVAKPEQVFEFCRDRGFELITLKTCAGGKGCNEYVFRRSIE